MPVQEDSWLHRQDKQEEEQVREAGGTDYDASSHLTEEEESSLQGVENDDGASSHLTEDEKSSLLEEEKYDAASSYLMEEEESSLQEEEKDDNASSHLVKDEESSLQEEEIDTMRHRQVERRLLGNGYKETGTKRQCRHDSCDLESFKMVENTWHRWMIAVWNKRI
jgi:hypothetical protein